MDAPIASTRAAARRSHALYVLTASEVRAAEAAAIRAGTDPLALMLRAGEAAARAIAAFTGPRPALVLCGRGNNGGDGYVIAAGLADAGWPVRVASLGEPTADPARAARARWTGPVEALANAAAAPLVIDALFGIGLTRSLDTGLAETLDRLLAAARIRVALDVPSGVGADDGGLLGARAAFDLTVAFGALKPAHLLHPAAASMGRVVVADIGLDTGAARLRANPAPDPCAPAADGHKAQRGHVIVLSGGPGKGGAARLAARAALRAGAGMVTLAVPTSALTENAARLDAVMLTPLDNPADLVALIAERRVTALALGPGLGTDAHARALAEAALATGLPLVLDADIFTLFKGNPAAFDRAAPTVLTPHEGEFPRLFGNLPGSKVIRTRAAAERAGAVVLLKGADTVIAASDGQATIETAAAPWLATAGSGDTLTGAIAARLGGGEPAYEAACAGAWLHARAGELAGPGMTADDLPELIGGALARLARA